MKLYSRGEILRFTARAMLRRELDRECRPKALCVGHPSHERSCNDGDDPGNNQQAQRNIT